MSDADTSGPSRLEKALKATRLLCVMACMAFSSFALVDLYMVETSVLPLYAFRISMVLGSLGIFWLSGLPSMRVHAYKTGAAISLLTGLAVVVLTGMTGGAASLYWTMLMLTFFTVSLIMPFRPIQAVAVFVTIALFYDVWMLITGGVTDPRSWVVSNAGVWLSVLVSTLAVVYMDDLRDREDADRHRLQRLNTQLREESVERAKAERDLRRTQQLDAVGRLAAGVAHELNNVLLVISSSAELIQRKSAQPDKYADRILESAHQGARLTSDMLLFAREGHREKRPFSLNKLVADVSEVVGTTHRMVSTVETELSPETPWVSGDSQVISQALLNLCLNATDAMETPGVLRLQTEVQDERVVLTVSDTGKGMTAEELDKAFEPFFTTKPPGKGTGLGLSMVYGTIKAHHGTIRLESGPGRGTSVIVELPMAERSLQPTKRSTSPRRYEDLEARVLLVDDDEAVRKLMSETLESHGFKVTQARNGQEACDRVGRSDEGFDLVILDMVMPLMGGEQAYGTLRAQAPRLPILLYSGNSPDDQLTRLMEHEYTCFIQKPFRHNELMAVVGRLLRV